MSLVEASGIIDPWSTDAEHDVVDPSEFRRILSHFASGVVVVTGMNAAGEPVGLTCQSFSALSLDPPLVLLAPAKGSRSWPQIAGSQRFAVNVLGEAHRGISAVFGRSGADKFAEVAWRTSPHGLPVLDDAIAVIECDVDAVHSGGDHWIVTGAVRAVRASDDPAVAPLIFFRSGYRDLAPTR